MTWLARFFRLFRSPGEPTHSERVVLERCLAGDDPRLALLREQIATAPGWTRESAPNGDYSLRLSATFKHLQLHLHENVYSQVMLVRDQKSRRHLHCQLRVLASGILGPLVVTAADGSQWSGHWTVDEAFGAQTEEPQKPAISLPPLAIYDAARGRLLEWLGIPFGELATRPYKLIRAYPALTVKDLAKIEASLGVPLPQSLRDFLLISDGVEVHDLVLLSGWQMYVLEGQGVGDKRQIVISVLAGEVAHRGALSNDGILAVMIDGESTWIELRRPYSVTGVRIAANIRELLHMHLSGTLDVELRSTRRDVPVLVRPSQL